MMKDLLQGVTLQDLQDESSDEESVEAHPFSPVSSVCDESLNEIEVSDSHSLNEFDLQHSSSPIFSSHSSSFLLSYFYSASLLLQVHSLLLLQLSCPLHHLVLA